MAFIPNPYGLTFEEWSSVIIETYAQDGVDMYNVEEKNWRDWSERLQIIDDFSAVPFDDAFATWQQWGERVVEVLSDEEPT